MSRRDRATPDPDLAVIEAPTAKAALEDVSRRFGARAQIISASKVLRGGIGGFFARELVQLRVRSDGGSDAAADAPAGSPDDAGVEGEAAPAVQRLLDDLTGSVDQRERTFATALRRELRGAAGLDDVARTTGPADAPPATGSEAATSAAGARPGADGGSVDPSLDLEGVEEGLGRGGQPLAPDPVRAPFVQAPGREPEAASVPRPAPWLTAQEAAAGGRPAGGGPRPMRWPALADRLEDATPPADAAPAASAAATLGEALGAEGLARVMDGQAAPARAVAPEGAAVSSTPSRRAEAAGAPVPSDDAASPSPPTSAPSASPPSPPIAGPLEDGTPDTPPGPAPVDVRSTGAVWCPERMAALGLPASVREAAVGAADDAAALASVADAVAVLCRPLPAGVPLYAGPRAGALARGLGVPLVAASAPAPAEGPVAVAAGERKRGWVAWNRAGRWLHLVAGGRAWEGLLAEEPLAVSWTRPEDLPAALALAADSGLVLGFGAAGGAVRRASPLDVAISVRELLVR